MEKQIFNKTIGESTISKLIIKANAQNISPKFKENYTDALQSCIICNSCRYCEGLCAVFPAMEKRREFSLKDIDYFANLCHQCSECFYDCQYAPPHEFNVSIPQQFAAIRKQSYQKYAIFGFLGRLFDKNALITSILMVIALVIGFILASGFEGSERGNFFAVVPYDYMVSVFMVVGAVSFIALCGGFVRFAREIGLKGVNLAVIWQSVKDTLTLRYLGGHENEGCTYPGTARSNVRKAFHHLSAYGFLFCFIATNLGAIYTHFLGLNAPYDMSQAPKFFGFIGGIMLCVGSAGLLALKFIADKALIDKQSVSMDYALIIMLFLSAFSGLLLMAMKDSSLLALTLYFHLSTVLVFFVMIPYSKFVHIFYRFIALLKHNAEEHELNG